MMPSSRRYPGISIPVERLPFGKPKRCLETDGVEIAKAYEKVHELERRLSLLDKRRFTIRKRETQRLPVAMESHLSPEAAASQQGAA